MYAGKYTTADTPMWVRSLCIFVCMYVHTSHSCHDEDTLCDTVKRVAADGAWHAEAIVRFAGTLSRVAAGLVGVDTGVDTADLPTELPTPCGMSGALQCTVARAVSGQDPALVTLQECVGVAHPRCRCVRSSPPVGP